MSEATWKIRMLYDGDCPLCLKEVDFLKKRDEGVGNIDFVDISSPDYLAQNNAGIDFSTAMGTIHAIRADGSVITGTDCGGGTRWQTRCVWFKDLFGLDFASVDVLVVV